MIARTVVRPTDQPIGRCPGSAPALVAGPQRSGEIGIGGDQIAGRPGALLRKRGEPIENGEIVLGVVDGIGGIRRCRPAEPGSGCRFRPSRKLGKVGKPALGGPDGLQSIEGRHARPGLVEIETRIGEADPAFGRAGRKRQARDAPLRAGSGSWRDRRRSARARHRAGSAPRRSCAGTSFRRAPARTPRRSSGLAQPRSVRRRPCHSVATAAARPSPGGGLRGRSEPRST